MSSFITFWPFVILSDIEGAISKNAFGLYQEMVEDKKTMPHALQWPFTVAKLSQSTIARDFIGQLMSRCSLGCAWTGKIEDRQGNLVNTCGH